MFLKSVLMALTLLVGMNSAHAAGSASSMISGLAQKAIAVMQDAGASEAAKKAKLQSLLVSNFDLNAASKFALGRAWREATPAQQAEYRKLYQAMIVEVYSRRFGDYNGETFLVKGETKQANGDVLVNSVVKSAGSNGIKVDWRVRKNRVVDVIVEGVSMAVTQRSDFAAVIERGGGKLDALLSYLRNQAAGKVANAS